VVRDPARRTRLGLHHALGGAHPLDRGVLVDAEVGMRDEAEDEDEGGRYARLRNCTTLLAGEEGSEVRDLRTPRTAHAQRSERVSKALVSTVVRAKAIATNSKIRVVKRSAM
jgi:hypothetical protein